MLERRDADAYAYAYAVRNTRAMALFPGPPAHMLFSSLFPLLMQSPHSPPPYLRPILEAPAPRPHTLSVLVRSRSRLTSLQLIHVPPTHRQIALVLIHAAREGLEVLRTRTTCRLPL